MTQKELAYTEDAIEHEKNIVSILDEIIKVVEDKKLIVFLQEEIKKHKETKEKLLEMLEVKVNE